MPQDAPPPDSSDQVEQAVRALMPALRRQAMGANLFIALAIGATVVGALLILNSGMEDKDRWKMAGLAGIAGFVVVAWIYRSTIRSQQAQVMPILASAIGLTYSKDAKTFLQALPKRLLPARGIRTGEDHVHGSIGAHGIHMAEIHVESGGKNSRTLFRGIVAQFPNRATMPAFFIAQEDTTRPGFFFGGDLTTEGLFKLRTVTGGRGRSYGIWTSSISQQEPPALSEVVAILTRIEDLVGPAAELYAATSNGVEMHIALTHRRNLFHIGGLFPDESTLFRDVRDAMHDLTVPLTLAKALIEAEEATVAKVKGA
ncbi:hypothetical protein [Tabrizicola sp.]|uniref:hypothetical protein n=1 Tax=Tabrizicola sp. TaxID=2005166 RepID=UPI0027331BE4|nr:hypothetical protein [Tabrizicola sp.]MDP3197436.1 hypothetical protein [Tabrizicola sp.]